MNTDEAYRDIGEAVVKGYIDRGIRVGISRIEVYGQRIGTKNVVFYVGNTPPAATFAPQDLEQLAKAYDHAKRMKVRSND